MDHRLHRLTREVLAKMPPAARGSFEKREACPWTPQNFLLVVRLPFLQEAHR